LRREVELAVQLAHRDRLWVQHVLDHFAVKAVLILDARVVELL